MKSSIKYKYIVILIVLVLSCGQIIPVTDGYVTTVKAYTEEQKQQAKAWLSAHGYPATKSGAYQAYNDYKNGKLTLSGNEKERVKKNLGKSSSSKKKKTKKVKSKKKISDRDIKKKESVQNDTKKDESKKKDTKERVSSDGEQKDEVTAPQKKNLTDGKKEDVSASVDVKKKENSMKSVYIVVGVILIILLVVVVGVFRRKSSI